MNLKRLATIFVLIVAASGCSSRSRSAAAIKRVLDQDYAAGDRVSATIGAWDQFWGNAEKIQAYATALQRIDLSDCPQEFQDAFLRHAYAWGNLAAVAQSTAGLNGFLRGLGGTDTAPEIQRAQREISDTWQEVDRVSRTYGVMAQRGG